MRIAITCQLKAGGQVPREPRWEPDIELDDNASVWRDDWRGNVAEMTFVPQWSNTGQDVAAYLCLSMTTSEAQLQPSGLVPSLSA